MEITRLADLKPRTIWEIIDDAFDLYRERFALLAGVSAAVFAPAFLLFITLGVGGLKTYTGVADGPGGLRDWAINMAWLIPTMVLAYMLQFGATAVAVRDILTGVPSTVASVYRSTFRRFLPLLLAALGISLFGLIWACTWIGPAVVAIYYCFTVHGILLEDRKLGDSLKRSVDMAKNYFGKSFGLFCLMGFILGALVLGMVGLVTAGFAILPKESGTTAPFESQTVQNTVMAVASSLITVLVAPLPAIATTLLYYDLRVRREGLDIESEAATWGIPLAPDPFGGVLSPKNPKQAKPPRGGAR